MTGNKNARKLSPIYRPAEKAGARFDDREGWRVALAYGALEDEVAAARRRVALVDCSANGKVVAEGREAESVVRAAWPDAALDVGQGTAAGPGFIYRLRADLYFASAAPGRESEALEALESAAKREGAFVTVTDITHGRSELKVLGPRSARLLSRLCGLDFHSDAFPNHVAKQSSLAKTSQLIIRSDIVSASGDESMTAFSLVGARSLAEYLWETVLEAGRDLDISPIGLATLDQLAGQHNATE